MLYGITVSTEDLSLHVNQISCHEMTPDLQKVEVVLSVRKLLHLTPPPLQLSDFQLQLCDEPLRPLLRCRLLPLDHLHQLSPTPLHETKQSGEDLHAFHQVPLWVFLQTIVNESPPPLKKHVLLIVNSPGCWSFTVQNDLCIWQKKTVFKFVNRRRKVSLCSPQIWVWR